MRTNKKTFTYSELLKLAGNGVKVERDYNGDTFGTFGGGYLERKGIKINGLHYQVCYTPNNYGETITSNTITYNGRRQEKHIKYNDGVNEHFYTNFIKVLGI